MRDNLISRIFLFTLIILSLTACFFIFRPYFSEILISAILATIFYRPYEWLAKKMGGRRKWAAFLMCLAIVLVIIIPLANLIVLAAKESVTVYLNVSNFFSHNDLTGMIKSRFLDRFNGVDSKSVEGIIVDLTQKLSAWLVGGATGIIKGTTNFVISLLLIILTLFFFFLDGKKWLERIMNLTPLPNKYDREIFKKFQDLSNSLWISTVLVAVAQGFACWLGFFILGIFGSYLSVVPQFLGGIAILAGVTTAFLTLIPFIGAWLIWLPLSIYLLAVGDYFAGIFLIVWGFAVIHPLDNIIRAVVTYKKTQIHPIIVIFSVLGGLTLFGFWGIIIGPMIISVTITIIHIYEIEYKDILEK
ncbi:MAG TPA: AI-2E family transporter [Candidatus Methylomirabilis sp.]|nr:AI-2E family transporter [Candidatus Methylomirabilis sp.]